MEINVESLQNIIFDEHDRSRFRIHCLTPSDFALGQAVERRRYIWTNSAWKTSASLSRLSPARPSPPNICLLAPGLPNGLLIGALMAVGD
jgi:hypothetical protein